MDQEKFEQMMAKWAEKEQQAMPELRPTREMYLKVKAKRQRSWFPFVNRWATLGVAAIALVVSILVLRPQIFQSSKDLTPIAEHEEFFGESVHEELLDEEDPRPPAPAEGEAPVLQREKAALEVENAVPETEEEPAVSLGSGAVETKDKAFSLVKKEDSRLEQTAPSVDTQRAAPAVPEEAPKYAPAPEPVQAPRRSVRSRILSQESRGPDGALDMKSAAPQVVPAPENGKGFASEPQRLADDMEQEESGARILSVPELKVFELRDGIWIDREHDAEKVLIPIQRHSPAFHDLLEAKPELREYSDRHEHIIINLGTHSIEISDSGKSELSAEELESLLQ